MLELFLTAYEDTDSLYATREDFQNLQKVEKVRGVHLLEHFVNHCNDLEVWFTTLKFSYESH